MIEDRLPGDRRRRERRSDHVRLADYAVPELRKSVFTAALLAAILALLAYMVHEVLVAIIAGVVLGAYLIPFHDWLCRRLGRRHLAAFLTISAVTVPLVVIVAYSWMEFSGAAGYLQTHQQEIARRLTAGLHQLPFTERIRVEDDLPRWVAGLAERGTSFVDDLQETIGTTVVSIAMFLVACFYVLVDHERILTYMRRKVSARYRDLADEISGNMRAVVYGALYATFLTQLLKSSVVLLMNLIWDVPLAVVLAIVSFFIGFFPIVGSWTVYLPVAIYLMLFRGDVAGGILMLVIGFFGITLFMSMYLRPKIAAEKSQVLNFFWMFLALVTGVYTFGLVGIIIGPVLIGVLKAVFDTVTGDAARALRPAAAEEPPTAA
ncbi:MAG: AI-2E family transporter [Gemmatimonadetes bacterium]|nr:AI-2E family transporter [Gemmatimonadota bacterium]